MLLATIIHAIEREVQIMRVHLHVDVEQIKETAKDIKDTAEDIANRIKTDCRGPIAPAELDRMLVARALFVPDATDFRNSITDLLKVMDLDASYASRNELYVQLGGAGRTTYGGSAEQNVWLHSQVMTKLAERERIPSVATS